MRVNSRVFDEKQDIFQNIRVPNCPSEFRAVAENILMMATKPGYSVGDYHTMTELDKILMVDYWFNFDGMVASDLLEFQKWFVKKATPPELIRRARQWLTEHNYLLVKSDVQTRAQEAGAKFRSSVRGAR